MKRINKIQHKSRRTLRRFVAVAVLIGAAAVLTAGCAGMRGSLLIDTRGESKASGTTYQAPSSFDNNSTVRLKAGRYTGDVDIRSNKVTIKGQGTGRTEIRGDVQIHGNSCTLQDVSVTGDVHLYGNNNDLKNARVGGDIRSEGNNNSW